MHRENTGKSLGRAQSRSYSVDYDEYTVTKEKGRMELTPERRDAKVIRKLKTKY